MKDGLTPASELVIDFESPELDTLVAVEQVGQLFEETMVVPDDLGARSDGESDLLEEGPGARLEGEGVCDHGVSGVDGDVQIAGQVDAGERGIPRHQVGHLLENQFLDLLHCE